MSRFHREHPDLVGTSADPWMSNPLHAAAHRELADTYYRRDYCEGCGTRLHAGEERLCSECEYQE